MAFGLKIDKWSFVIKFVRVIFVIVPTGASMFAKNVIIEFQKFNSVFNLHLYCLRH